MLRHVPARTRQQLSDQFARLIWDAVRERDTRAQVRAFLTALTFSICMLLAPASQRHRDAAKAVQSTRALIKNCLTKWMEGHMSALWLMEMQRTRRHDPTSRAHDTPPCNRKRAMAYAQNGPYTKAIQTLQSSGVHEPTASVLKALKDKHAQSTPASDELFSTENAPVPPPIPPHTPFTTEELMKAVRKFPKGTSGGGSGLSRRRLLQLLRAPRADRPHGLQRALVAFINQLDQGEGPRALGVWITGAPITPLRKDDGGARPIAVGETI